MSGEKEIKNYLDQIYKNKIEIHEASKVLLQSQIPKGNKLLVVDTSVLFVDIRESTKMNTRIKEINMTKVYRMFGVIASKAVRDNDGQIVQFMGDGFMAAFNSSNKKDSRMNAYQSVLDMFDLFENVYQEVVEEKMYFKCGYAISTGHIYMNRLKAKKYKLNSFGIFPGKSTNLASKLCNIAGKDELIIDQSTYDHIKNINEWEKHNYKGEKIYKCKIN